MPYRQIYWIKLEKRLLNDYRYYTLSPDAQRIYVKLLMLAADTANRIPKDSCILLTSLRETLSEPEMDSCIQEIKKHFPKFKDTRYYYQFVGWKTRHNQVIPRVSPEYAGAYVDKIRIDKIRIEYIKIKGWNEEDLISSDYARLNKRVKELLLKAKGDCDKIIAAMDWVSHQGYSDWTLETVLKKWPDFAKRQQASQTQEKQGEEAKTKIEEMKAEAKRDPIDPKKLTNLTSDLAKKLEAK